MGDSSDNIPGVNGIGEKGALSLISQFGTLENVYESFLTADLKPSVIKKLESGRELAFLSQMLARIEINVPNLPSIDSLRYGGIDKKMARELFEELEFGDKVVFCDAKGFEHNFLNKNQFLYFFQFSLFFHNYTFLFINLSHLS